MSMTFCPAILTIFWPSLSPLRCELLNSHRKDAMNTLKRTIALVSDVPRPHTLLAGLYWADGIFSVAEGYKERKH